MPKRLKKSLSSEARPATGMWWESVGRNRMILGEKWKELVVERIAWRGA